MPQLQRLFLAVLIPLATCGVQLAFQDALGTSTWFLLYPAVFFAALATGLAGGVVATLLATGLGWYFFLPPRFDFAIAGPGEGISALVFATTGIAFSLFAQRMLNLSRDLGERRQQQRLQAARIRLMEFMADHTLHEFLVAVLDEAGDLSDSPIGFFHFLDADQRTLSLQAWSTRTTRDFCKAAGAGTHYDVDQAGVWADAVRERRPVVHNDYAAVAGRRGLPEGHAAVVRELVVPVFRQDRIVALVGVGNKPAPYTDADLATVARVADLAWDYAQIKRGDEALRESEERWKFALEGAGDGVWDWNLETGEVVYSRRWREMLGYGDGDGEIGHDFDEWRRRTHPDDADGPLAAIEACARGEASDFRVEQRLRGRDGAWKWVLARGRVVRRGADGRPLRMTGTVSDVTAHKEAERQVSFMAYHDRLTGLPNRFLFFDRFAKAMSQARRKSQRIALLFVDLDGFKEVNDALGHDAGDAVLKAVGTRFLSCVRTMDTVARVGGDEFVLLLPELGSAAEATVVATRLLAAVAPPIALPRGGECRVGASVGISLYPDQGGEMDTLLAAADAAMYESKRAGGGRYTFREGGLQAPRPDTGDWIEIDAAHLTGIATIDDQHRELARHVNAINRALRDHADEARIERLFAGLADYVRHHFDTERSLMDRYGYPERAAHVAVHEQLLADLANYRSRLAAGDELFVLQWIKDWLLDHTGGDDQELGAFLRPRMAGQ